MESQDTSIEARSCGETGEEFTIEIFLPLRHDQQKLPGRFKGYQALRTAGFVRINTARVAMAKRIDGRLQNHLASFVERQRQASQPSDHTPYQAMIDDRLLLHVAAIVRSVLSNRNRISDPLAAMLHRCAITGRQRSPGTAGPGKADKASRIAYMARRKKG